MTHLRPLLTLQTLLWLLAVTALAACGVVAPGPTASPTELPAPIPTATETFAPPTATPTQPAATSPAPAATRDPEAGVDLPRPLYLLIMRDYAAGGRLWVLRPGAKDAEPVQSVDEPITRFDVSARDGRLAYGTLQGRVYVQSEGEAPRLLFDGAPGAPYPVMVSGIGWSPDGQRLAYTIGAQKFHQALRKSTFPARPTGVWVQDVGYDAAQGAAVEPPLWLVSNAYLSSDEESSDGVSFYEDPLWSPDGQSLVVREGRFQDCGTVWFDSLRPVQARTELQAAAECSHAWAANASGLYLGRRLYVDNSNLAWTSRDGATRRLLFDGQPEGVLVGRPFDLGPGIAFTATRAGSQEPILFFGTEREGAFQWAEVRPNPLCAFRQNDLFVPQAEDGIITLLCGNFDLRLIDPALGIYRSIDLSPFLQPGMQIVTQIHWGP